MANTIKQEDMILEISDIDSDWSWTDNFPFAAAVRLDSIQFNPGAAADACVIKYGSDAGVAFFDVTCENESDEKCKYFNCRPLKPVFDFSDSIISAGAKIIIMFS